MSDPHYFPLVGGAFGGKESQPVKICVPVALAAQRYYNNEKKLERKKSSAKRSYAILSLVLRFFKTLVNGFMF